MNKYKICVYAICKNEEQFVDRWMDAVGEADMVVVTDTGSTDNTVNKLRSRGAIVFVEHIEPWRFDSARNIALNHIPEDIDICVPNDLDEVFEPGWRSKLEAAWQKETTRAKYLFTWTYHQDGTPNKQYPMEKIHTRHDYRWIRPVHEILEYHGSKTEQTIWVEGLVLNHYPDPNKPRSQYLPLLELAVKENPYDDRAVFWLGREYMYYKKYEDCIKTLKKYLELPSAVWDEEKSASMRFIALSYSALGNTQEAKAWLYRSIAECPHIREPYLAMAKLGYMDENWPLVYAMAKKGLSVKIKSGSYLVDPESWSFGLYDLGAISAYRLGRYEEARYFANEACKMNPEDERLKSNLFLVQEKLKKLEEREQAHESL